MLFHLRGPLKIHDGGPGSRPGSGRAAVVLATLLHRNVWAAVDRLVDVVWPEPAAPPARATAEGAAVVVADAALDADAAGVDRPTAPGHPPEFLNARPESLDGGPCPAVAATLPIGGDLP